jgi:hypothetical protein
MHEATQHGNLPTIIISKKSIARCLDALRCRVNTSRVNTRLKKLAKRRATTMPASLKLRQRRSGFAQKHQRYSGAIEKIAINARRHCAINMFCIKTSLRTRPLRPLAGAGLKIAGCGRICCAVFYSS